jgi:hypothetical protein
VKDLCACCQKPPHICICDRAERLSVKTRVLVLQHPDEQDALLSTAPLLDAMIGVTFAIGTEWASLSEALGERADPKAWGVLYPSSLQKPVTMTGPFMVLNPKGDPVPLRLQGIIALDGTWSQAKSIWWKNAWLLKCNRVLIQPTEPSIYGRMRREPRREWISTLESVAEALVGNGEDPNVRAALRRTMRTMIQRARDDYDAREAARAEEERAAKAQRPPRVPRPPRPTPKDSA